MITKEIQKLKNRIEHWKNDYHYRAEGYHKAYILIMSLNRVLPKDGEAYQKIREWMAVDDANWAEWQTTRSDINSRQRKLMKRRYPTEPVIRNSEE